jgi:NADH:ubiquinone oxidoreductase subunit F (NADH-binding)
VVLLNDSVDMLEAALTQMIFFEDESCGQCAPCRIGTQILHQALDRYRSGDPEALSYVREVAWGMTEASICGLGQAAALPLTSAMKYWTQEFGLGAGPR